MNNCKNCSINIPLNRKFCSRSCSAIYNNSHREKQTRSNEFKLKMRDIVKNQYTNNNSEKVRVYKSKSMYDKVMFKPFEQLSQDYKRFRVLLEQNNICNKCKLGFWLNVKIPLELDHIDGDTTNNNRNNLEALCPNCHALTPTYRGRNKIKSRFPSDQDFYQKFKELGNIRQALIFFKLAPKGGNYLSAKHKISKFDPTFQPNTTTPVSYFTPCTAVASGDSIDGGIGGGCNQLS